MRKTKIICTLGPSVDSDEKIEKLIEGGMDCARLNFSHGTHEEQLVRLERVRRVAKSLNKELPILLDTKGPEIRIRLFKDGFVDIVKGQEFTLSSDYNLEGNNKIVGLTYPYLAKNVKVNDKILIDDGKVALTVTKIDNNDVVCEVLNGGRLSNRKSINIPNVIVKMDYLSKSDKEDILFGIKNKVDFIAASFVRSKSDVVDLKNFLHENGGDFIKIISKIENIQGIENLDEIITVTDGIMVARGDMGVEVSFELLPAIQKEMIGKCYRAGKFVVTATQMLESMTKNPRPTRAEVSDVANAVYDKTTAIMLSGESAAGDYPIEAVNTMAKIALSAESSINYEQRFYKHNLQLGEDTVNAIANAAVNASFQTKAKAIICVTMGGITADLISSYRPSCPIIAVTVDEIACRQLNLAWGTTSIKAVKKYTTDEIFKHGVEKALETGIVKKGDIVVITGGSAIGENYTDSMIIHKIKGE